MFKLLVLAIAGALGTVSRYVIDGWVSQWSGAQFPFGTLIVNASGCLAIGFLGSLADERLVIGPTLRLPLLLGFLGAFTTFSSFAYETWMLVKGGEIFLAGFNVLGNVFLGFLGLFIGIIAARLL